MRRLKNFHVILVHADIKLIELKTPHLKMKHFFPFETFIKADKIKDVHFTRKLKNFVYDVTDA